MSIFIMPEGTKASDVVMLLQACHRQIDIITAQRDRLAKLLRIVADRHENGMPIPSREIAAALAELDHPTTTAPTNDEGDAK